MSIDGMQLLLLLSSSTLFFISIAVECGIGRDAAPRRFKRIVGGQLASEGGWPWHVSLLKRNETDGSLKWAGCGGTVIGSRWVLTAVHCIDNTIHNLSTNYSVLIGSNTATVNASDEAIAVKRLIPHPDHGKHPNYPGGDDIALLELDIEPSSIDSLIPVCLPSRDQNIPIEIKAVSIGFGVNKIPDDYYVGMKLTVDGKLRETTLSINQLEHCGWTDEEADYARHIPWKTWRARNGTVLQKFSRPGFGYGICAGDEKHTTFKGDIGGPMMMKDSDGRWFQIGICSNGFQKQVGESRTTLKAENTHEGSGELGTTQTPIREEGQRNKYEGWKVNGASFTNVHKYCDWIEKNTEGEVKCPEVDVTFQQPPDLTASDDE